MKKHTIRNTNIIFWICVIIVIIGIAVFTLQQGQKSADLTHRLLRVCVAACRRIGISDAYIAAAWWNNFKHMRRIAHTVEYFALGLAVSIAIMHTTRNHPAVKSVLFCACVSVCDQLLKIIVPRKEFEYKDFPFDIAGYMTAILIVIIIRRVRKD